MVQALKSGELDYAIGVNAAQFDDLKTQPNIAVVNGVTNGWTMLNFNCYDKDIPNGGASTKALRDPKFRDALGYAIDKQLLIDRVLGGYGETGHDPGPAVPVEVARRTRPAAHLRYRPGEAEADGRRLSARRVRSAPGQGRQADQPAPVPAHGLAHLSEDGRVHQGLVRASWASRSRRASTTRRRCSISNCHPPRRHPDHTADWDMIIWSWTGYADPNPLLQIFTTGLIGSTSDSLYSNPTYDALYDAADHREVGRRAPHDHGPDAEHLLRRCAVSRPDLRRHARGLPDRQVRWLDEPARQRHAALRVRLVRLSAC